MNDPLIHIPLYLDEWHARLSGYDYLQRGAFITLFIAYVKSSGELNFEGNNSALFRACGAITDDEQKSLLEIYKEVKLFADPRITKQVEVRETRRKNAQLGGIAKGLANAKPNAKILAEQKVSKRSAKSELELESDSERELKEEKDTIVSKKKRISTLIAEKPSGVSDETWKTWVAFRQSHKWSTSQIVVNTLLQDCKENNADIESVLKFWIAYKSGWQGFRFDWLKPEDYKKVGIITEKEPELEFVGGFNDN